MDISDPALDLVIMGAESGVSTFLTATNYRLSISSARLQNRTMYFANAGCTGAAGADIGEAGIFPGELFANGGSIFYIPFSATINASFAFASFRGTSGGCFDVADSASVWPAQPNNAAVTGISIPDPDDMSVQFQR
ncbi:MAG: hypothetical protein LAT56_14400 [Wenzhouxiangella sp.]|nr:hypothetical protein [Wenzhouxiangella sp.]